MSKHIWLIKRLSPTIVRQGLYAYCLARNGGYDPLDSLLPAEGEAQLLCLSYLPALSFAGYVMESIRQKGGVVDGIPSGRTYRARHIWYGARSHHRYAKGRNARNYELAGRKMLAAVIRSVYGRTHNGPDEQLGGLLFKLEESGDALPVIHDYLEESRYEECLLVIEGSFKGFYESST